MQPHIFHLTTAAELETAAEERVLAPASLESQGFAHASYRHQLVAVANAVFGGHEELVVLELDPGRLSVPVRAEPPDPAMPPIGADSLFPHIYGPVGLDAEVARHVMRRGEGGFELPELLRAQERAVAGEIEGLLAAYEWYDHPRGPGSWRRTATITGRAGTGCSRSARSRRFIGCTTARSCGSSTRDGSRCT